MVTEGKFTFPVRQEGTEREVQIINELNNLARAAEQCAGFLSNMTYGYRTRPFFEEYRQKINEIAADLTALGWEDI